MGPIELKFCICALVDIPITIVVFFVCQVARKTSRKKGPLSRWPMDAVSELQPANAIASALQVAGRAEFKLEPFLDCDRVWPVERWVHDSTVDSLVTHTRYNPYSLIGHTLLWLEGCSVHADTPGMRWKSLSLAPIRGRANVMYRLHNIFILSYLGLLGPFPTLPFRLMLNPFQLCVADVWV